MAVDQDCSTSHIGGNTRNVFTKNLESFKKYFLEPQFVDYQSCTIFIVLKKDWHFLDET